MYKKRRAGWIKHIDFMILDVIMLILGLYISCIIRNENSIADFYYRLAVVVAFASICVGILSESYKDIVRRGYYRELVATVKHNTIVSFIYIVLAFFIKGYYFSRFVFIVHWGISIVFCYITHVLWKLIIRKRIANRKEYRRMLLVTTRGLEREILRKLDDDIVKDYKLVGVVYTDLESKEQVSKEEGTLPVLGVIDEQMEYLKDEVIDEIYIYLDSSDSKVNSYIDSFVSTGMTVHVDLHVSINPGGTVYVENISGNMVLTTGMKYVTTAQAFVKRAMDIAGAIVGLIITGIACIFVIPAIKIADPGPAFYSQIRIGKNGRRFKIYKFRSMYKDADKRLDELMDKNEMKGLMFKMENDPRIIKGIGNFIRNASIDELPQFWNVLKGDMSLVGTRPPTEKEYVQYAAHHLRRTAIRPGITGMWQTSGRSNITDFEEIVRLDAEYISNWSIGLDIKIILKTILVVFKKEGSK